MRLPPGAVSPAQTRLVLAVLAVHQRDGRATVRSVMDEAGLRSPGSLVQRLRSLRDLGLIAWEDGHAGTLRPGVAVVRVAEPAPDPDEAIS